MPKHRRILCALLFICSFFMLLPPVFCSAQSPVITDKTLSASAESAILMLADSQTVLHENNADHRMPMASTTKVMTALVSLELLSPTTVITVDSAAVGVEGSSVYLVAGERLTLEQLLYALLLESANDAAVAIAIAAAGSVENFSEKMNEKAAALGLHDTHFTNPHGLDDRAHYTTARELAIIACAALQHPLIRTITATVRATIPHPDAENERLLINHNKLLRTYDGCIGVKTGYTKRSGRCLVSAAERDGVTLVAVTLNAYSDWTVHKQLLDRGFSLYTTRTLCEVGELQYPLPVSGGAEEFVTLSNRDALRLPLPVSAGSVEITIEAPKFALAPIQKGEHCATAQFFCDTDGDGSQEHIASLPLTADDTVEQKKTPSLWERFFTWFRSLFHSFFD